MSCTFASRPSGTLATNFSRWPGSGPRKLGSSGVSVYWIVNVQDRQLEVYSNPTAGGVYPTPTILKETDSVELIIAGQPMGQIAVADLLP